MSVWGKLFTAVRGGINESAQAAADSQAMRVIDQEIRDAENALRKARSDLAGIMASAKRVEKRVSEFRAKEERDIASAKAAMEASRFMVSRLRSWPAPRGCRSSRAASKGTTPRSVSRCNSSPQARPQGERMARR